MSYVHLGAGMYGGPAAGSSAGLRSGTAPAPKLTLSSTMVLARKAPTGAQQAMANTPAARPSGSTATVTSTPAPAPAPDAPAWETQGDITAYPVTAPEQVNNLPLILGAAVLGLLLLR